MANTTNERSANETDQLRRRNRELRILNEIAKSLNRLTDIDDALHATLSRVVELFDLQTGWIWLLDEQTEQSYLAASQNLPPALVEDPLRMEGSCYCLDTYKAGDMEGAANVSIVTCSRLYGLVDGTKGLRHHASIPLYAHGKKLGVMNVASTNWRRLAPEDLRLLYTIGDLLGIAVERTRLSARSAELGAVQERNRLAREIHDTLAQGLSAVILHLESADAMLEADADGGRVQKAVRQSLELARANLEEARRSVIDLRAAPLEGRTLVGALKALAAEASRGSLRTRVEVSGANRPLPVRVETGLFRIAQEALNNVAQHAKAQKALVRLITTPGEFRLVVSDDGRGFELEKVETQRFGLTGMNERARLLGGTLQVQTAPGEGTVIEVTIPTEKL